MMPQPETNTATACPGPLDLTSETVRHDPYPYFRWYREHDPMHRLVPSAPDGVIRYLVTRWHDCESGLKEPRLRREVHSNALWNKPLESVAPEFLPYASVIRAWPLFQDPPRHARTRRPINRTLDEAMTTSARPLLHEAIQESLQPLTHKASFDAITEYALAVPNELGRRLFGLEETTWRSLASHLQKISLALGTPFSPERICEASSAIKHIEAHLRASIPRARKNASDAPMLARLLDLAEPSGLLEESQIVPLSILLLQAGQDSVIGTLANGLITFLRHPGALATCLAEPRIFHTAVDEVLRFESPVHQVTRHAAEDFCFAGTPLRQGEGVSFLLGAANRDPRVFEDPETFQPDRTIPATAAFGFGPHKCPGMDLGKQTAATAWQSFFTAFPNIVHDEAGVRWRPTVTFRVVATLPCKRGVEGGKGCAIREAG